MIKPSTLYTMSVTNEGYSHAKCTTFDSYHWVDMSAGGLLFP